MRPLSSICSRFVVGVYLLSLVWCRAPLPADEPTLGDGSDRKRPNVLFLSIDDLNDWVGALGGHPQAKTPNLDRLIARSVSFTNAHCAAPVCSASRHALLSGLRPSTTGWYGNTSKKLADYEKTLGQTVPMPTHFKRNGYRTMAAGKIFHKGTSDVDGYEYWDEARPRFKWPERLSERGHGYQGKNGGHFHPFPPDGGAIYQKYGKSISGHSLCWGALRAEDMPDEGMPDEQIAEWAVERLQRDYDQPFLLAVGFVRPHVPYTAPRRFFDLYPLDQVLIPQVPSDEMSDIPLLGKVLAYGTIPGGDHQNVLDVGPEYWREMTRAYLACVSFVDEQAGKVLDALDASPHANNTVIVIVSDHGQHLGEKRHWRKMALWEESTRVPLAIRVPGAKNAGQSVSASVSLIDVYPTLIDICDVPSAIGLEGQSLTPLLNDVAESWNHPAVTTWFHNNHSVRDSRWRYIRYRDGSEELYDHKTDPGEHDNVAGNPANARQIERLSQWLPAVNKLPKGGMPDGFANAVKRMKNSGVPAWLE